MAKSTPLKAAQMQQKQQQQQPTSIPNQSSANNGDISNDVASNAQATSSWRKKKKNKKKSKSAKNNNVSNMAGKTQADMVDAMMNNHVIRHGESHQNGSSGSNSNNHNAHLSKSKKKKKEEDSFWSTTNNTEERQKIREFWLQLGEEERRSLVKVEKEAVLRKMKEQQKHSCNCSVCGKKRTAIEDELEVLYDAYYEELEQYANHQQQTRISGPLGSSSSSSTANPLQTSYLPPGSDALYDHGFDDTDPLEDDDEEEDEDEDEDDDDLDDLDEEEEDEEDEDIEDDEEEYEEDDEDEEDEDDEDEDDDDYDDIDDQIIARPPMSKYGEKSRFEEMSHIRHTAISRGGNTSNNDHFSFGNSLTVKGGILTVADDLLKNDGKKFLDMMEKLAERRMQKEDTVSDQGSGYFQEEEDEDDDEAFDDEEDEDTRTEEQRMEEGRRMFQIFAARMFEQRVLAAYREKVAQERQQRLLEELEEEDRLREERELKKQREREKRKDKKRQLKQQQEAERLAAEAKRKAEEEAAKREKEKKQEAERQRREQERLKKEEEKRQKEEERLRREEEKRRRAREEKERAAEKERKRKEKEEKERLDNEKAEKEERERREKSKLEKERLEKERLDKQKAEKVKADKAKKETEEKERLEQEKVFKAKQEKAEKAEKERLKRQVASSSRSPVANAAPAAPNLTKAATPEKADRNLPSPGINPPTMNDTPPENRQQVLIEALVGPTAGPAHVAEPMKQPINTASIRTPNHFQPPPPSPFVPSHLDIFQNSNSPSVLSNSSPSTLQDISPMTSLFNNNRISSPLEPDNSSTRRSITSIAPIGQPLAGRRVSAAHLSSSLNADPLHLETATTPDPLIAASNAIKRPSVTSPFDTTGQEPRSFFSSFLFGEPRSSQSATTAAAAVGNNFMPMNDYDRRFSATAANASQSPLSAIGYPNRRTSSELAGGASAAQNKWLNGWTASNLLSENVHDKLFGDALQHDRNSMILERAKVAYQKLNEITQADIFRATQQYHTLIQLHCMMNDLYGDFLVDIRELYEVLLGAPLSGFQCINHAQHGMIVLFDFSQQQQQGLQHVSQHHPLQQPQQPPHILRPPNSVIPSAIPNNNNASSSNNGAPGLPPPSLSQLHQPMPSHHLSSSTSTLGGLSPFINPATTTNATTSSLLPNTSSSANPLLPSPQHPLQNVLH